MLDRLVFSVAEVNTYVQKTLAYDPVLQTVRVRGEVSNAKTYPSNHTYFTLKDDTALLRCVWFQGNRKQGALALTDGLRVVAKGNITLYVRDGQYQLNVTDVQPDGIGAWFERYHAIKAQLQEEGLFDPSLKKKLPHFPRRIGVVTSEKGAAIRDIVRVAHERFPAAEIILRPVAVQGAEAAGQIAQAIEDFSKAQDADVLIVGRGGGSIEDLWAFNEPIVAYAIAACSIPVISAVGHEIDESIADYVADVRAATPSNAAELATPDVTAVLRELAMRRESLRRSMDTKLAIAQRQVQQARRMLHARGPMGRMMEYTQRLDYATQRLSTAVERRLGGEQNRVEGLKRSLADLDPKRVLQRGYAVVTDEDGRVCRSVGQLAGGDKVNLWLHDGVANAVIVEEVGERA